MTDPLFHYSQGDSPLLVSMPHVGTALPTDVKAALNTDGQKLTDTDWYVDQLYDFLDDLGCSVVKAHYSRTVIDLNREPDGKPLYPGQSETGLCPTTGFDGGDLYLPGKAPDSDGVMRRKEKYWQPYHNQIRTTLEQIKAKFGYALLWDAHSIQREVPRFFDGILPDLNIGTANGTSCDTTLANKIYHIGQKSGYQAVLNGRFKGGYITRHYGDPDNGVQSMQMEITQASYMDEAPTFQFREDRAQKLRPTLTAMIEYMRDYTPSP